MPVFASVTAYGDLCAGTLGPLSLNPVGASLPFAGETFQMDIDNVTVFAPVLRWVGVSKMQINGPPLPLSLHVYRMPGCFAYMSGNVRLLAPANITTGVGYWSLLIPLNLDFLSIHQQLQEMALELGSARGGTKTNGLDVKFGNRGCRRRWWSRDLWQRAKSFGQCAACRTTAADGRRST